MMSAVRSQKVTALSRGRGKRVRELGRRGQERLAHRCEQQNKQSIAQGWTIATGVHILYDLDHNKFRLWTETPQYSPTHGGVALTPHLGPLRSSIGIQRVKGLIMSRHCVDSIVLGCHAPCLSLLSVEFQTSQMTRAEPRPFMIYLFWMQSPQGDKIVVLGMVFVFQSKHLLFALSCCFLRFVAV